MLRTPNAMLVLLLANSKTRVDWARCINDNENRIVQPVNPFPDLLNLKQAYRAVLAEKVDNGKMTIDEAKLAMAQLITEITTEAERRLAARRPIVVSVPAATPREPRCVSVANSAGSSTTCY